MNKIALKKFVIIRYLACCNKYPYGYGIYTESVGDFRLTSLICDILDYHHSHKDSIFRDEAKRILKYIDTRDTKYLIGINEYNKNRLLKYIA